MRLDTLSPAPGSRKDKKRVGRGDGSRKGTFSGRGCKGQKSRSGFRMKPGFEGGQLPIIKRLPSQRGFNNIFKTEYDVVNIGQLSIFEAGTEVDIVKFLTSGLVKTGQKPIKVLGEGEIDRPLTVKAEKFSATAKSKIEAAGGKVEEVTHEASAD
ncbi:MAG: 50S ribosomal protein L15 [Dehalococcoidales bacterium]|nr:50S ribosomal protein L15 [Dehalococcoidales bacterium]